MTVTTNETGLWYPRGGQLTRHGRTDVAGIPNPPSGNMFVGAAWSTSGAGSDIVSVVGNMFHRTYENGIPTTFAASRSGKEDYPNGRGCWQSLRSPTTWLDFSAGMYDTALVNYLASIPANYPMMLTFNHEPENGDDDGIAAHFQAAGAHFYDIVHAHRPDIPCGPIYIGQTFSPYSGKNPADWDYGPGHRDFIGVDAYQRYLFPPAGSPTTWNYAPAPWIGYVNTYAQAQGVPMAVGELACGPYMGSTGTSAPNYQMKVDYISSCVNYVESNGGLAFCYFNTNVNNDMSPYALLGDDSQTEAYWTQLIASHKRGLVTP